MDNRRIYFGFDLSDWETLEANIDNLFWDKEAISTLGLVLNAYNN